MSVCECVCVCCPQSSDDLSQTYMFSWSPAPARSLLNRPQNLSPDYLLPLFLLWYLIYPRCDLSASAMLTHAFEVSAATNINGTELICNIFLL